MRVFCVSNRGGWLGNIEARSVIDAERKIFERWGSGEYFVKFVKEVGDVTS